MGIYALLQDDYCKYPNRIMNQESGESSFDPEKNFSKL